MPADPDLLRRFGERIREERLRRGYSQGQLADLAQLDRTYVSDVERGTRNLGLRNIGVLAEALGLEPHALLSQTTASAQELIESQLDREYLYNSGFSINCGFIVTAADVLAALTTTKQVLRALPLTLFTTIDLKSQSGIVGAIFAAELAAQVSAIPNPIEKGHPDIVPPDAANASEAQLRNYPMGLEIKSTLGNVVQGSKLDAGHERIDLLTGITWQAHHRDVRSLMGLVWDFVGGRPGELSHPSITGVFFAASLAEDDWGAISGTTGRNTKVTGMKVSGRQKMATGCIVLLDDPRFRKKYAATLGVRSFPDLETRIGKGG